MQHRLNESNLLFESSWEVCNKIGGIYAVLSTKANVLVQSFGDNLIFVGPDLQEENPSFIPDAKLQRKFSKLTLPFGVTVRMGRWDVPGKPIAALLKFSGVFPHLNEIYGRMWECFGVDSLHAYGDYDEGCAFGVASALFINEAAKLLKRQERDVIAHFDEWTTAMGLLYLRTIAPQAASIFTTHATSIGRSICGNGKPLYDYFENYNGDQMAGELNMQSKHSLEKCAAHAADCFTTVSEVTARECQQLLDIKPQVITPNGFEPDFVPTARKYSALRKAGRAKLLAIAEAMTGEKFPDDTFILATSGRNEYRNKGIDLFIDACLRVGSEHAAEGRKILALILVPGWVKEPSRPLKERLAGDSAEGGAIEPAFVTHRLNNEDSDPIFRRLSEARVNNAESAVKIIDIPVYLDGNDGIVDIAYYDLLPALDLSVFASYYEPWGYTPLESIAFGVPTISTDKAGFGQWVLSNFDNTFRGDGARIVARTDSNYEQACAEIASDISELLTTGPTVVRKIRKAATATASQAEWTRFIAYYEEAFEVAEKRRDERLETVDK